MRLISFASTGLAPFPLGFVFTLQLQYRNGLTHHRKIAGDGRCLAPAAWLATGSQRSGQTPLLSHQSNAQGRGHSHTRRSRRALEGPALMGL
jgi:hypothetical protein